MFSVKPFLVWHILLLITCMLGQSRAEKTQLKASGAQNRPLSKLKISSNGRYFVREDGSAFIWIGDTSWHVHAVKARVTQRWASDADMDFSCAKLFQQSDNF